MIPADIGGMDFKRTPEVHAKATNRRILCRSRRNQRQVIARRVRCRAGQRFGRSALQKNEKTLRGAFLTL